VRPGKSSEARHGSVAQLRKRKSPYRHQEKRGRSGKLKMRAERDAEDMKGAGKREL